MGSNTSKERKGQMSSITSPRIEDLVDLGGVFPNGLYSTKEQEYDPRIIQSLIKDRRMAPFYKGLEDAPIPVPETILTLPTPPSLSTMTCRPSLISKRSKSTSAIETYKMEREKERERTLYNNAVECPICFLYYPPHINYSRCCGQPICTECFIQIHRPIETPSVPSSCPFCTQENYGITYEPPQWGEKKKNNNISGTRHTTSGVSESPRRVCVNHMSPNVVLTDHIRPKLDTSSVLLRPVPRRSSIGNLRRVLLTRPNRSASSTAADDMFTNRRQETMDLEDWMVMNAIRLSLAEQVDERKNRRRRI
ncbi:unnamed protein product [Rhizopus stolonifer]